MLWTTWLVVSEMAAGEKKAERKAETTPAVEKDQTVPMLVAGLWAVAVVAVLVLAVCGVL